MVEIGTRRALGATTWEIFAQILCEAAFLAALGCAVGFAAGYEGARLATARANLPFGFDVPSACIALGLAGGMNLACALLPAVRAARISPIAALRLE